MKYKALILDLDGTTIPSSASGQPSQKVKDAIKRAKQHIKVTIATGRPLFIAERTLKILNIDQPCVVNGGAQIIDPISGRFLFQKYISPNKQKQVFKICQLSHQPVFTDASQYQDPIASLSDIKEAVAKLFIDGIEKTRAINLLQELEAVEGISAHPTSSWRKGDVVDIHITNAQGTKLHAIKKLLKFLGVSKAETIGIGDHFNDLPLFESVGLKIVMGNAPKEIKAIADHIAPDLEHDGVAVAIEKFIPN